MTQAQKLVWLLAALLGALLICGACQASELLVIMSAVAK